MAKIKNERIAVMLTPQEKKRALSLQKALSAKRGGEIPMTQVVREGLTALADRESISA